MGTWEKAHSITFQIIQVNCLLLSPPENQVTMVFQPHFLWLSNKMLDWLSKAIFYYFPQSRSLEKGIFFRSRNDVEIWLSTYSRCYINCLIGEAFSPLRALAGLEGRGSCERPDGLLLLFKRQAGQGRMTAYTLALVFSPGSPWQLQIPILPA